MSDDELKGRERIGHIASGERIIEDRISRGPVALSWHMGLANAEKALATAQRPHPSYEIVVVDAVVKVGKPAKAAKCSHTGVRELKRTGMFVNLHAGARRPAKPKKRVPDDRRSQPPSR